MPINNITQTISTLPPAGSRGVDVQTQFVIKQEDFQDHLQGTTVTELNTLKDQLNSRIGEINSTTTTMNGYANTASAGASTATTKAGEASTSAGEALAYRNQAETFKNNASASATKASQWADNNYNVEVETGKYSAKHWSTVAQNTLINKVDKVASTDNAVVRFDGETGEVQNSGVIIDDSGNVGIGVTPSAWTSNTAIQMKQGTSFSGYGNSTMVMKNAYYDGAFKYVGTGYAQQYEQNLVSGAHNWRTAPAGTAGNPITWNNAMSLDTSGKLNILGSANKLEIGRDISGNYTSYDSYLQCFKTNSGNTTYIQASDVATNTIFASFLGGVLKSAILANGTYQSALGAGGYGGTSDIKLKENITDSSNKLDKLMKVRVVDYNFKSDEAKLKQIGVIAQELEEIFPSVVYEINDTKQVEVEKEREITLEDGTTEIEKYKETETVETGEVTKGVKYGVFTMLMLKGMQEQQEIINDLKARIEVLEGAK